MPPAAKTTADGAQQGRVIGGGIRGQVRQQTQAGSRHEVGPQRLDAAYNNDTRVTPVEA